MKTKLQDPNWSDAFDVVEKDVSEATSFLDLVRRFRTRGDVLSMQRQHPGVTISGRRYRLENLNLLEFFKLFLRHHEDAAPDFVLYDAAAKALHCRLHWIEQSGFSDDIRDQRRSLGMFLKTLTVEEVNEAISKAFAAPQVTSRDHRWRYACAILHPLRRLRIEERRERGPLLAALALASAPSSNAAIQ